MPQAGHGLSTGAGSKMTDEDGRPKEHWREPCSASIASDFSSLAPLGLPDDALLIHCQTVSLVSNRETGKFLVTKKEKEMSRACAASFPSRSQLCAADSQAELNPDERSLASSAKTSDPIIQVGASSCPSARSLVIESY